MAQFVASRALPAFAPVPAQSLAVQRREARAAGKRAMAERMYQLEQKRARNNTD